MVEYVRTYVRTRVPWRTRVRTWYTIIYIYYIILYIYMVYHAMAWYNSTYPSNRIQSDWLFLILKWKSIVTTALALRKQVSRCVLVRCELLKLVECPCFTIFSRRWWGKKWLSNWKMISLFVGRCSPSTRFVLFCGAASRSVLPDAWICAFDHHPLQHIIFHWLLIYGRKICTAFVICAHAQHGST